MISIFRMKPLNIRTATHDFFVRLLSANSSELTSLTARMLLGAGMNAAMEKQTNLK